VTGTLGESLVDEIDGQMKNRTGLDRLEPDADSQASGHGRGRWRGGRRAKEAPARTSAGRRSLKHVGCAVAARARLGGAKQRSHASTRRGRLTGGQSRPPQARGSKIPEERGSRRRQEPAPAGGRGPTPARTSREAGSRTAMAACERALSRKPCDEERDV